MRDEIDQFEKIYDIIITYLTNYSFQLLGAVIIVAIGYYIASKVCNLVLNVCERKNLDITLTRFLANTAKIAILVLMAVVALGKLGISVTPFIAAIGAVSLGAGLALQGLLANYAAGFNIIFIRPFVVGDTITVQGQTGIVKEVLLAYTILIDEDGVEITIPNKHIVGDVIENSRKDSLVKLNIGVAYRHDPKQVIAIIEKVIENRPFISQTRQPQVGLDELGNSSINIMVRLWTPTENLYAAKFEALQLIYDALKDENISIPFPQREVRLLSEQD
ncbi:mechanosensitive ion channel family protein [Catenovulum sp. SM1970]|nr:mechanosensitive ion channel family protein [Marinifaba aquimaris]